MIATFMGHSRILLRGVPSIKKVHEARVNFLSKAHFTLMPTRNRKWRVQSSLSRKNLLFMRSIKTKVSFSTYTSTREVGRKGGSMAPWDTPWMGKTAKLIQELYWGVLYIE